MDKIVSERRSLISLFFKDLSGSCNGRLKKGMQEYQLLLLILRKAIHAFENKELEKFDALVGENACQIRAVKIVLLASKEQLDLKALKEKTELCQSKIDELLSEKTISRLMSSGVSLSEIIESKKLEIDLNSDELFIFLSFLLSEAKQAQPQKMTSILLKEKGAPENLKNLLPGTSSQFAKSVLFKARRLLAQASVFFAREAALKLEDKRLIRMTSDEFTREFNTWPTIPMFWTYKTLLNLVLEKNIPVVLKAKFVEKENDEYFLIDQDVLFFKSMSNAENCQYFLTHPSDNDLNSSVLVIEGIVDLTQAKETFSKASWREKILQHAVFDIILAGAADHRQYPDPSIAVQVNDIEYERYKIMASAKGFSINNPSYFFINHVYPIQGEKMIPWSNAQSYLSASS